MNVLESLLGRKGTAEPVEPKLRPEVYELYLKLPPAKRRRLVRWAEQQATDSLAFDRAGISERNETLPSRSSSRDPCPAHHQGLSAMGTRAAITAPGPS